MSQRRDIEFPDIDVKVEQLLLRLIEEHPEDSGRWLEGQTNDPAIRSAVLSMLDLRQRAARHFERLEHAANRIVDDSADQGFPAQAGPWRLLRLLGRGGMSAVYLAERVDGEFEQTAAVKLLPSGPAFESLVQRFQNERRILARLEHPNLARMLDGGVTDGGLPYFVMEYVDGLPIDRYCTENQLGINDRLALFEQVLDVVRYAHRNLIVHRDLKPSNILVTGAGQVKLLDFGIAKLLNAPDAVGNATELTQMSGRPFTPAWASPEQIAGATITTASDIYSLGLLLHWLLTGRSPYRLEQSGPQALHQAILEQSISRPSARVRAGGFDEHADALAAQRGLRPDRLARRLRGDLDNIILVCLRKDPEQRYASVDQLADDLDCHRRQLPVRARGGHWRYRAGRFLTRHRYALGVSLSLPLIALAALAWHVDRLSSERDRAELEAQRAEAAADTATREAEKARLTTDFMVGLFRQADPVLQTDQELNALELLERGRSRIDEMDVPPELRAQLLWTFARVYETRADYPLAVKLYEQALELLPENNGERAEILTELAMAHFHYGDLTQAEASIRDALDRLGPEAGFQHGVTLNMLGNILRDSGRGEEAEAIYREAIAVHDQVDPHTQEASTAWNNLGIVMGNQRRFDEAREAFEHALAIRLKVLGPDHPWTSIPQASLGFILLQLGEHEQARIIYEQALAQRQASLGAHHPRIAAMHLQLGHVFLGLRDAEAAASHFEAALSIFSETLAPGHRNVAVAGIGLAEARLRQEQIDQAERLALEALHSLDESSPEPGLDHAAAFDVLGRIASRNGAGSDALHWHHQAYDVRRTLLGEHDDRRWLAKLVLAESYLENGATDDARSWLAEARQALGQAPERFPGLHARAAALDRLITARSDP